jgi:biopolymer transport protein ExbD
MRRFSQKPGFATLAEINVTPLLDLCFVLLVIFMITTPLLDNSMDLAIPTSAAARNEVDASNVNTISIDRFGQMEFGGMKVSVDALTTRLESLKQEKGAALSIVIRAHRELPVQRLIDVMDILQKCAIAKVGVITQSSGAEFPVPDLGSVKSGAETLATSVNP